MAEAFALQTTARDTDIPLARRRFGGDNQNSMREISTVRIQNADFDLQAELAALHAGDAGVGAVCSFVGVVRSAATPPSEHRTPDAPGDLLGLEIEHYPGMTERAIHAMVAQARARFAICSAAVIHRIGYLPPQANIVLVAVTAPRRRASFQACEFLMDYLKTQAPFWKKEWTSSGAMWVDARESDDHALARWGIAARNSSAPDATA